MCIRDREKAQQVCREAEALGVSAQAFRCDVADFGAAAGAVAKVVEAFGTLDILVNNAGVTRDSLILNMKEEDYDAVLDTNLKGAFNMIRHASPVFLKKRSGRTVSYTHLTGLLFRSFGCPGHRSDGGRHTGAGEKTACCSRSQKNLRKN